jgi:hypothetical protein
VKWVEIFAVFLVSHLVGDYLLQTEWQARNKWSGLSSSPESRRALLSHVAVYGLCFVPAFIWIGDAIGAAIVAVAALVVVPHLVQDDGRLLVRYIAAVKGLQTGPGSGLFVAIDQSFHVVALFLLALLASSWA